MSKYTSVPITHDTRRKLHLIQLKPSYTGLPVNEVLERLIDAFLEGYHIVDPWPSRDETPSPDASETSP